VLYGFPGHFARLAQQAAGAIKPRLIFTSGEMLDGATRKTIEAGLGAPVFDIYGCTELKEIAWECPAHIRLSRQRGLDRRRSRARRSRHAARDLAGESRHAAAALIGSATPAR
jgi:acyl-coenzyme A synthetase/AMP-(fatty) acid ligase